jgi:lipopolysaccharide export LptBFGC system permease protein LptF
LIGGLWIYLRSTTAKTNVGKYGRVVFVVLLLAANIANIFGSPMGGSRLSTTISALTFHLAFAGIAYWLDRKRA